MFYRDGFTFNSRFLSSNITVLQVFCILTLRAKISMGRLYPSLQTGLMLEKFAMLHKYVSVSRKLLILLARARCTVHFGSMTTMRFLFIRDVDGDYDNALNSSLRHVSIMRERNASRV